MNLFGKSIDKLEAQDILQLKENKVPESLNLEYKRELPGDRPEEKKEFLADVSAFANKAGGLIIYGVEEERDENGQPAGYPKDICGLAIINQDKEKQRLEQIISAGLDSKLSHLVFRYLEVNGKGVLLLGIPRSLFGPHVVWFQRSGKFYIRTNTGKAQMDVHELRRAFLQRSDWETQADSFRRQRIMDVQYQGWIPNLDTEAGLFIHLLPLGFDREPIDLKLASKESIVVMASVLQRDRTFFNLDGVTHTCGLPKVRAYIHCFRNGGLEIYICSEQNKAQSREGEVSLIDGGAIALHCVDVLKRYLPFTKKVSLEPPIGVFLTLINVLGKFIVPNLGPISTRFLKNRGFDRNDILLQPLILEQVDIDTEEFLASSFDVLWQAGGWIESPF